jgi:hypothetical protein
MKVKAAMHELLQPGIEQVQALILEDAASNHDAYLINVNGRYDESIKY